MLEEDDHPMTCSDFLARYSDYRDGSLSGDEHTAADAHVEGCDSCRRYHRVVSRGVALLRELPTPRVRGDLESRVRHSVYSMEEAERARRYRPYGPTGGGAMALVAAAVLVVAMLWTPTLFDNEPTVELPAIVVSEPLEQERDPASGQVFAVPPRERAEPQPSRVYESKLWAGSNSLLFEHSSLYQRHRDPALVRAGLH